MSLYEETQAVERELIDLVEAARRRHGDRGEPFELGLDDGVPPDVLTIGLVGGTGVGKSSLVNALAGSPLSVSSVRRPTTRTIIPYVHAERLADLDRLDFVVPFLTETIHPHHVDRLRSLFLFDLPDIDSVETGHAEVVAKTLPGLDIVVWVTSLTKYGDRLFHDWIRRHAAEMDLDNFIFVLNKTDEISRDEAAEGIPELRRRFEKTVRDTLAETDASGTPAFYLMSALHAREARPGNQFLDFERDLFRERDQREFERIKASNRLSHLAHQLDVATTALCLGERRRVLEAERDLVQSELEETAARPEVRAEMEAIVRGSAAESDVARRFFETELRRWPLLTHMRLVTVPLRQGARALSRLNALAQRELATDEDPARAKLAILREDLLEIQKRRRRRESRIVEPEIGLGLQVHDDKSVDRCIGRLENECVARVREAAAAALDREKRDPTERGTWRHLLVWGPVLWFPLVQPILQEILNPESGTASLALRLAHRLVRISGAAHLLVSLVLVLLILGAYTVWIRVVAWRRASRTCRDLLTSTWWQETMRSRLRDLLLGDVTASLEAVEDEERRIASLRERVERLKQEAGHRAGTA